MEHMILSFQVRPEAKAALEHLLLDLQDPSSPRFHQWLTPEQFATAYGPKPEEIAQVSSWLISQGFTVESVGRNRLSLTFTGDAAAVEQAFRTPMMDYLVQGQLRHANAADPSIPTEFAQVVGGVVALHDIPKRTLNTGLQKIDVPVAASKGTLYTANGGHYLAPADFATIYNVNPVYANYTGAGVTIGIIGRTQPTNATANWAFFRSFFGLPANPPIIVPAPSGAALVDQGSAEDGEADLDVEWSGAVAKGASIKFICGVATSANDGVDNAVQYAVDNNVADILSLSFGACENDLGNTWNQFYGNHWAAAAAQGISVFVASGDSGAAGCDAAGVTSATSGLGINGLGSSPYNVSVGGTQFNDSTGTWWSTNNSSAFGSALGYIPEVAWNESGTVAGGSGLWASGGGVSSVYLKPSWQGIASVPSGSNRYVPDISLAAGSAEGYMVYSQGQWYRVGGTSASSPAFAGLMALVVQATGGRQGNPNPHFYAFGSPVLHDITSGNNSVPGRSGFLAKAGYDQVTGMGSVDANAMIGNWAGSMSFTPVTGSVGLLTKVPHTFTVALTGLSSGGVTWTVTPSTDAIVTAGSPSTSATFTASVANTYTLTAIATANSLVTTSLQVQVHDPDLTGTNTPTSVPNGMDVLAILGHFGVNGPAWDLTGDAVVDGDDLNAVVGLLGW